MTSDNLKINGTIRKHLKRNVPSSALGKRKKRNGTNGVVHEAVAAPDLDSEDSGDFCEELEIIFPDLDLEDSGDIDFCEELERILQDNEDPIHGFELGRTQTSFIDDLFDLKLLSICENFHTHESTTMDSDVEVIDQEQFTLEDILTL